MQPVVASAGAGSVADAAEHRRVLAALQRQRAGGTLRLVDIAAIRRFELQRDAAAVRAALEVVPLRKMCELLGVNRWRVREWEREGMPWRRERGAKLYDLFQVLPWLRSHWMSGAEKLHGLPSKRQAEIRLMLAKTTLLRIKTLVFTGEFVEMNDYRASQMRRVLMMKAGMETMHRQIAPMIVEQSAEQVEAIVREHTDMLLKRFKAMRFEPGPVEETR